ncbi:hypothetical protein Bpfe_023176 [Biomphalaria pfeifferi]|uniref:Apextrin C-terminal domain-containing protein n=1 Tax=Biomphalaria pfeifferi TaxID=112525 RepID=A0AAD8B4W4_BIOPF|nr:hypothetical protein Bpfe_023176 [Biomphalaria pfeifferi]
MLFIVVTGLLTSSDTSLNVYFDIVTPDFSSSQEDNVTLQCQVLGITLDSDIKVAEYTIFFHQLNDRQMNGQTNQWQTLAQISQGSDHVTSKDGNLFLTKGSTGTALDPNSIIQLTWRRSDFDIADDYRCDVTYYTSDSREPQKDSNYGFSSHWPIGSYCINRVGRHCPAGFKSGGFRINEEKNYYSGTVGGFLLETGPNFYLRFCCRADGSPTTPIILPNGSPFYLSKFGNLCQEVYGMTSTEEFIYLDTDDSSNEDMAFPPHPEGFANNGFQMWMCYYKPN